MDELKWRVQRSGSFAHFIKAFDIKRFETDAKAFYIFKDEGEYKAMTEAVKHYEIAGSFGRIEIEIIQPAEKTVKFTPLDIDLYQWQKDLLKVLEQHFTFKSPGTEADKMIAAVEGEEDNKKAVSRMLEWYRIVPGYYLGDKLVVKADSVKKEVFTSLRLDSTIWAYVFLRE